ncbi:MAG: hypothetical protein LBD16_00490 [Oscillospiraceae bacterium]|jgi:hypothetical protein|nr:hypothetical protein [Oscillospiraceae bacterium]
MKQYIALILKSLALFCAAIFITMAVSNAIDLYRTDKTLGAIEPKTDGYVQLPFSASIVDVSVINVNELYTGALEFYKLTVDEYSGVLIDVMNYENAGYKKTLFEEYGQNWITVNHNYLEFNPVYLSDGVQITVDMLNNRQDIFNLLIPKSLEYDIYNIKSNYQDMYGAMGLTTEQINAVVYDDAISDIYTYTVWVVNSENGKIESPVIEIWNEKYLGNQTGNYFGDRYFLKIENPNPLETLRPLLTACGLENIIINTPAVADAFNAKMRAISQRLTIVSVASFVSLAAFLISLLWWTRIFCKANREKISEVKRRGARFATAFRFGIAFQALVYLVMAALALFQNVNMVVLLLLLITDTLLTITLSKRRIGRRSES